ncbi:MAG: AAA family ATPase [Muribaculaceae bacterium]|nr:AAA family ATPase [Muribaculaceae bacterium]
MAEYLKIENFGPIDYAELADIRPLTVLIGESGSGKSTIMKVLSLFRWMYKRVNLRSFIKHSGIRNTRIGFKTLPLLKTSGMAEYLKDDSKIVYRNGKYEIKLERRTTRVNVSEIAPNDLSLEKICFISDKRSIIPDILSSSIDRHRDNFYLQDTLENFRTALKSVAELSLDFLDVDLKVEKSKNAGPQCRIIGRGTDGSFNINLRNASSGMQTATPLSVIIQYYAMHYNLEDSLNSALFKYFTDNDDLKNFRAGMNVGEFPNRRVHIFIEEPELSLYPDNQTRLMDFLVNRCFAMEHPYQMSLMIATHSPYILNYLNLLIARSSNNIEERTRLSSENIDAYLVDGGTLTQLNIVSNGDALINATALSDPIAQIYREYNSLKH